jgi:fructokinase
LIAVVGEALIDLVAEREGGFAARPGGGPFNTARTIARLGESAVFLGRLSGDGFGAMLRRRLDADGVTIGVPEPSRTPTTLAVADVDSAGVARYGFYLAETAAADLDHAALATALAALAAGGHRTTALHVGTLGLVMEPIASGVERLITTDLPPDALVMADPNCRPGAITDRDAYLARLDRILRRTDVVKASVEDLAYLLPDAPPRDAAAVLLKRGPRLVLVTDGPHPARAFLPGREITTEVPPVEVVDTIGAGDAFGGGFLAWWTANGLTRADLSDGGAVTAALAAAAEVASLTCARAGADPPRLAETQRFRPVLVTLFAQSCFAQPCRDRAHCRIYRHKHTKIK